jgi:hypothetical protein
MPFVKGKSGNAGGRKATEPVRAEAGRKELAALKGLIYNHALTKVRLVERDKEATGHPDEAPKEERRIILALTRLYNEAPADYLNIMARVMPKDIQIEGDFVHHMESWNSMLNYAAIQTDPRSHQRLLTASPDNLPIIEVKEDPTKETVQVIARPPEKKKGRPRKWPVPIETHTTKKHGKNKKKRKPYEHIPD